MKLKRSEIKAYREKLLEEQGNKCAICECDFSDAYYSHKERKKVPKHRPMLDHDHKSGAIRGVLCSGCNSVEGLVVKGIDRYHTNLQTRYVLDLEEFLQNLAHYYNCHFILPSGVIHPKHKSDEDKRVSKNRKARMKRKKQSTK